MSQSLSAVVIHAVFSTKGRAPMIVDELRADLFAFLSGCLRQMGAVVLAVGGTADHVHLLFRLPRTVTLARMMQDVKRASSVWMRARQSAFEWQAGYGAFSVSPDRVPVVQRYVARQEEHHHVETFQEEFLRLLAEHDVDYQPEHLWD